VQDLKKNQKDTAPAQKSPYIYYILCKRCHAVNVPAVPGLCSCCARKENQRPHDNYRPPETSDFKVKQRAYKCGALPWIYRGRREDNEMCYLSYNGYFISVQRQPDRRFCYIVGNKKESVLRQNITELAFARTRSVRHLAKMMNITFDELIEQIKTKTTPPKKKGNKEK
jgi:hypothetical protein